MRNNQRRDPRVARPLQASETVAPPSPPCVTSSRPLPRLAAALLTPSARSDRGASIEDLEPLHRRPAPELPHPCLPSSELAPAGRSPIARATSRPAPPA